MIQPPRWWGRFAPDPRWPSAGIVALAVVLAVAAPTLAQDATPPAEPEPAPVTEESPDAETDAADEAGGLGAAIAGDVAATLPDEAALGTEIAAAAGADQEPPPPADPIATDPALPAPEPVPSSDPAPTAAIEAASVAAAQATDGAADRAVPGQPDPTAGNGGSAGASADGGTVITSAIITGNNRGNTIDLAGCAAAATTIDGGTVENETTIDVSANGGTAIADASGGEANGAIPGVAPATVSTGNGGAADAAANGGIVVTSAMITGNNRGNTIDVAGCPAGGTGDSTFAIDGGTVRNSTTINVSADGGTALADAGGGDQPLAGGLDGNAAAIFAPGNAWVGHGGSANASADGGIVITSAIITGNNRGNEITVGNGHGDAPDPTGVACLDAVAVDGGTVTNETVIDISADGGLALADASGGDGNLGVGVGGVLALGDSGTAEADANGGIVVTNPIITGNNRGSTITVDGCHT